MRHEIKNAYQVSDSLYQLVVDEILPGLAIEADDFWSSTADILDEFMPQNKQLLAIRERMQEQINEWHLDKNNLPFSQANYEAFLKKIGYLTAEVEDFSIGTEQVDDEVAKVAGPQLVVPLMNARFALNAANARWGSLYDALYGSDVISQDDGAQSSGDYNPKRGKKVQDYGRDFLDMALPLLNVSHKDAVHYQIKKQIQEQTLLVTLKTGQQLGLAQPEKFIGFKGETGNPESVLCKNNGLHIEIQFDSESLVGGTDPAAIKDIVLEAAVSTIQDCEDSIAAVDAEDKTLVYRNWLGLMKGDLTETITKNGRSFKRQLNPDREYLSASGETISLPGRSLQFIRNVGHLMNTDAILNSDNQQVPEGIIDGLITSLISLHDLNGNSRFKNSQKGSIYIVKPKMHGPDEVKFTDQLFSRIEQCLNLAPNTIKMGIMDEERRTSANLKACIFAAKDRVAFINTGFLDRTGDEIHTSMLAGAMARKELMKNEPWIAVYEKRNVRIGLETGFKGRAQIGKGMWAVPDDMSGMMREKINHLLSGANCAWVPSPTAAVLHAMHYHQEIVAEIQDKLICEGISGIDDLSELLTIPLLKDQQLLTPEQINNELDNNVQGLLGYVVRWINQGVGCSKVPDIHNVGRMEDRATLRISSQHICNWLHHKIITAEQITTSLKRMAKVVDEQNKNDVDYLPFYPSTDTDVEQSIAYSAAADLIFKGEQQPSGYTEPLLHQRRVQLKQAL